MISLFQMVSILPIAVCFCFSVGVFAAPSTITKGPQVSKTLKAMDSDSLRSDAARADISFFSVFLQDFKSNMDSYTSYLGAHDKTMPQEVADYYYHIAKLPNSADLEKDIASSLPFSQFRTFIADFPWYSTLLSKAHKTSMMLPQDFAAKEASHGSISPSVHPRSSSKSVTSVSSSKSHSHNGVAARSEPFYSLWLLIPFLVGMLL